jgi:acyl-CoA synthetase (AMP-forming)/AMP-acid ligase II
MILSGGLNVYPVDIEAALLDRKGVREAIVFGIEDPRWGEVPVALVHLDPSARLEAQQLMEEVNCGLARHQRMKDLALWPTAFPRNSMGKVPKAEMREAYLKKSRAAR